VLLTPRSRLVAAAASAGKPVIDSPFARRDDLAHAAEEAHLARSLSFSGKAAIHPKFVPGINQAFAPTASELEEARAVLAAFTAAGDGVARIGGKLVELPVVRRMRSLLERAGLGRAAELRDR
jgi:citrate lyase beta subunit